MFLETTSLNLSLAVHLIDYYTAKRVLGNVEVSLQALNSKPVRNPGGYYLFFNIPDGVYTLQVTGGDYYFNEEQDGVRLSDLDRKDPVIPITLTPTPSYPFSLSATLIRGCVRDKDNHGRGIPEATISVQGRSMKTRTTEKGGLVLCFTGLKKDDVETVKGKKLVKLTGNDPVLEIAHPDYTTITQSVTIEEGAVTSLSVTCT